MADVLFTAKFAEERYDAIKDLQDRLESWYGVDSVETQLEAGTIKVMAE